MVAWAARRVARPVKWTGDRSEAFLTDYTARDVVTHARLGFDRDGRMLALALVLTGNTGAHTVSYVPLSNGYRVAPTVYDVPIGVGATAWRDDQYGTDRAVPRCRPAGGDRRDGAADRHRGAAIGDRPRGAAPSQPDAELPRRTATGLTYDSGDFAGNLARVLEAADWNGFPTRRRRSEAARAPARNRRRQLCRDSGRHPARARQGRCHRRRRRPPRGHAIDRPGPRDQLPPGDGRPSRRCARGDQLPGRRQRHAGVGRRHPFRPLHAARRLADGGHRTRGDQQGAPHRRAHARGRGKPTSRTSMACSSRQTATVA